MTIKIINKNKILTTCGGYNCQCRSEKYTLDYDTTNKDKCIETCCNMRGIISYAFNDFTTETTHKGTCANYFKRQLKLVCPSEWVTWY